MHARALLRLIRRIRTVAVMDKWHSNRCNSALLLDVIEVEPADSYRSPVEQVRLV